MKFEKNAGSKWESANACAAVAIRRTTATFQDRDGNKADRTQFPLTLAKACTIHNSQAATYHAGVHARLDKSVREPGSAYVALSRSPTQQLCTLERFQRESLKYNHYAAWALAQLKSKLAKSPGPKQQGLQELWDSVVRPAHGHDHYEMLLESMQPFNRRTYLEEQRAKDAPADDAVQDAKTNKPKTKSKAKATAKRRAKATAKAKAKQAASAKAKAAASKRAMSAAAAAAEAAAAAAAAAAVGTFFEHQQEAQCGMHALNNALGKTAFTPEDMATAAETYLQEWQGIDEAESEHIRPGGWYSVQILYAALFNRGIALNLDEPVQSVDQAHLATALVQNWNNQHWVAYRWGADGAMYRFDSLQRGPERVSEADFAASLVTHWTYAVLLPCDM